MTEATVFELVKLGAVLGFLWWRMNRLEDSLSKLKDAVSGALTRLTAIEVRCDERHKQDEREHEHADRAG